MIKKFYEGKGINTSFFKKKRTKRMKLLRQLKYNVHKVFN